MYEEIDYDGANTYVVEVRDMKNGRFTERKVVIDKLIDDDLGYPQKVVGHAAEEAFFLLKKLLDHV